MAARENAVSEATMKDLQNLVKAITLNSKIDESRDFAASVQEAMVDRIRDVAPAVPDRGVRTAPFYVLIGANMPSVLAEISFVSNPQDEKLLRTPEHRDRIAESLFEGVRAYLDALNRTRGTTVDRLPPGVYSRFRSRAMIPQALETRHLDQGREAGLRPRRGRAQLPRPRLHLRRRLLRPRHRARGLFRGPAPPPGPVVVGGDLAAPGRSGGSPGLSLLTRCVSNLDSHDALR